MPRYFFHVVDSESSEDTEGCDFADFAEARQAAASLAGGVLQDGAAKFDHRQPWSVRVADEAGQTVYIIHLRALEAHH